jgi:outer membrane protein TolC
VAISNYYPKISLAGALGFDSINGGTLFNGKAFQAVGTGSLRWRLFDFGRVKAEIAQSRGGSVGMWWRCRATCTGTMPKRAMAP